LDFDPDEEYQSHPIYGKESVDLVVFSNETNQWVGQRITMNNWAETLGNIAINTITGEPVICCVPGINLFTRENYNWGDSYTISIDFELDELWSEVYTPFSIHVSITSTITETLSYIIRLNKNTGSSQSIGTLTASTPKTFDFTYSSNVFSTGDYEDFPDNLSNDWIEIQIFNDSSAGSAAKALFEYRFEIFIAEKPIVPGYFLPIIFVSMIFGALFISLKRNKIHEHIE
jgi:hypothetical protein